jgi:signal peptidase I
MSPSLRSGELVLLRRVNRPEELDRGSVVVLRVGGRAYIKRVYAGAGEVVWGIDSDAVEGNPDWVIEGDDVDRLSILIQQHTGLGELVKLTVPSGHVFVLGDAYTRSYDSRHFGAVPIDAIIGRVVRPRYPPTRDFEHRGAPGGASTPTHGIARACRSD